MHFVGLMSQWNRPQFRSLLWQAVSCHLLPGSVCLGTSSSLPFQTGTPCQHVLRIGTPRRPRSLQNRSGFTLGSAQSSAFSFDLFPSVVRGGQAQVWSYSSFVFNDTRTWFWMKNVLCDSISWTRPEAPEGAALWHARCLLALWPGGVCIVSMSQMKTIQDDLLKKEERCLYFTVGGFPVLFTCFLSRFPCKWALCSVFS